MTKESRQSRDTTNIERRSARFTSRNVRRPASGFDYRRQNIFGRTFVDTMPQPAMAHAVQEIDGQPNDEPNKKTNPSEHRQAQHQRDAENHAKNREPRHQRHAERPGPSCVGPPQNDDSEANEDEGEKRSDI